MRLFEKTACEKVCVTRDVSQRKQELMPGKPRRDPISRLLRQAARVSAHEPICDNFNADGGTAFAISETAHTMPPARHAASKSLRPLAVAKNKVVSVDAVPCREKGTEKGTAQKIEVVFPAASHRKRARVTNGLDN